MSGDVLDYVQMEGRDLVHAGRVRVNPNGSLTVRPLCGGLLSQTWGSNARLDNFTTYSGTLRCCPRCIYTAMRLR